MSSKKLYRSRDNKMIAGVCGGIADYLGWDATFVRVIYVLLSVCSVAFPGILVYILLAIIIPERPNHVEKSFDDVINGEFEEK
ncbi:PspC domain-containing protein [Limosilactobacillus equigenerosi]|uniref:Phage shock protein PspC N-terminal domain-containing protein n=1 Tax=Limosilactobacillus equigenerosi DSM 18793 = JCM 14505 TaxID=1423742 RepID=A0A0R1UQW3_9LACO|nr:PspC domain-containing protein [Limosilactobacillus equigenerosi]KRL93994.1 hypothetical protein FC21_GL001466 [Limosilactobacillus equigenerosi DSM 18793 = JCM 14505]MCQ2569662.1 PspC domain-containing protein [Limosilactobacillus sp.]